MIVLPHHKWSNLLLFIPEGESDVHAAMGITDTCDAIFTPSKGAAAGLIVGEVGPSIAVRSVNSQSANEAVAFLKNLRIVFSDRGPLPLGGVAAPSLPVLGSVSVFSETPLFGTEHIFAVGDDHFAGLSTPRRRDVLAGGGAVRPT